MKARINGYNLLIPKSGNATMSFLEWIANNGHINNLIYRIWDSKNSEYFDVRLDKHPSATKEDCMNYINAKL